MKFHEWNPNLLWRTARLPVQIPISLPNLDIYWIFNLLNTYTECITSLTLINYNTCKHFINPHGVPRWWAHWSLGWCKSRKPKFNPPHYWIMRFPHYLMGREWNSLAKGWDTTSLYPSQKRFRLFLLQGNELSVSLN